MSTNFNTKHEDGERLEFSIDRCFIHTLPVELLLRCFFLAINDISCKSKTTLALSHVCCRWRSATLESKELWTFIPLFSMPIAELYMQRSDPLTVVVQYSYPITKINERHRDSFSWLLTDNCSRIRELVLLDSRDVRFWTGHEHTDQWDAFVFGHLHSSLSRLEVLQLTNIFTASAFVDYRLDHLVPLLCDLFINFSNLPSTSLACHFAPNLTHLTLRSCGNSFHCLAATSKHLTALKKLDISDENGSSDAANMPPFTLPNTLEHLHILASSDAVLLFFQTAHIPLRTAVSIFPIDAVFIESQNDHIYQTTPLMITDLVDAVFARATPMLKLGYIFDSLALVDSGSDSVEIRLWVQPPQSGYHSNMPSYQGRSDPYSTSLRLAHRQRQYNHELALGSLMLSITQINSILPSIQELTSLEVLLSLLDETQHVSAWRVMSNWFPRVTHMNIVSGGNGLLRALGDAAYLRVFPDLELVVMGQHTPETELLIAKAKENRGHLCFATLDALTLYVV